MATYRPKEGTQAAQALEFIERVTQHARGAWVANTDVADALQVRPNAIMPALGPAINAGLVEKSLNGHGFTQWRLGVIKSRRAPKEPAKPKVPVFSLPDWPPGFVPRFETVVVPQYEERRK